MYNFICLTVFLLLFGGPAYAQKIPADASGAGSSATTPSLPNPLTTEGVRDLVSTMTDADARKLLVQVLDGLTTKAPDAAPVNVVPPGIASAVQEGITGVTESVSEMVIRTPRLATGLVESVSNFFKAHGDMRILGALGVMLLAIAAAMGAEWLVNKYAATWRGRINSTREPESLVEMFMLLAMRLLIDLGGLFAFFAMLRLTTSLLAPAGLAAFMQDFLFNLVVVPRAVAAFARLLLSPKRPELRLVHTDDWTASFLQRQIVAIAAFIGFGTFLIEFQAENGVPLGETRLGGWITLITFGWIAFIIWKSRSGLSSMMAGWEAKPTVGEAFVAKIYPRVLLAIVAAMWLVVEYLASIDRFDLLAGGRHYLTLLLIALAPAMDTGIRAMVRHILPPMRGEGEIAERAWLSTRRSYIRIVRVIVFGLVVLSIARIWDISLTNVAAAGVGAQLANNIVGALVVALVGYLVWELAMLWINRQISNESTVAVTGHEDDSAEGGGAGGSRLATVLPLLRMTLQAAIIVMTALIALGQIGIDITPLLAGAGIVGLAIGFGAQTLVKDIVSGLFFLMDDAFRVGEYIVVGSTEGTVEKISLRSMQLRHTEGSVHTIPYGEIPQVTNSSRDWVLVKMKFTVPFDTDMRKVKKIFKSIGAEMLEQPYAPDIIETFKLQGVGDVNDIGMVIRGKFKAKPGRQWVARKDIYSKIQQAFEQNGIEFARREVRVNVGGAQLDEAAQRQIASAAAEAVSADLPAAR
jgi:moderate conductance mechanosensitive channel